MRKRVASLLFPLCVLGLWGCVGLRRPPAMPKVFLPVVEREMALPRPGEAAPAKPPQPAAGTPQIHIVARIFGWPAAHTADLGFDPEKPATLLSHERYERLIDCLVLAGRWAVFCAPRLTVVSSQKADLRITRTLKPVMDYDAARLEQGKSAEESAVTVEIPHGLVVELQAAAEGGEVVFTGLEARLTRPVELCECKANATVGGKKVRLVWQEPVVLTSKTQLPQPCNLRLKPGEALVVPIRLDSLVVNRSKVRALVKDGKAEVTRDQTARFLAGLDKKGYPVESGHVVLMTLSASLVTEAAPAPKPK